MLTLNIGAEPDETVVDGNLPQYNSTNTTLGLPHRYMSRIVDATMGPHLVPEKSTKGLRLSSLWTEHPEGANGAKF